MELICDPFFIFGDRFLYGETYTDVSMTNTSVIIERPPTGDLEKR